MIALGVLYLEFKTFLGGELIQAEVDGLSKFFAKLLGHEWVRTVTCYLCEKLYDHIGELKGTLSLPTLIVEMLLGLFFLLITQLTPCVLVLLK